MRTGRNSRFFVIALAAVALVGGSAFTAGISGVDQHTAGTGTAAVDGVSIDGFSYGLSTDKETIESVTFDYASETGDNAGLESGHTAEVAIYADGTDPNWVACDITVDDTQTPDGSISCPTTDGNLSVAMGNADNLSLSVMDDSTQ